MSILNDNNNNVLATSCTESNCLQHNIILLKYTLKTLLDNHKNTQMLPIQSVNFRFL